MRWKIEMNKAFKIYYVSLHLKRLLEECVLVSRVTLTSEWFPCNERLACPSSLSLHDCFNHYAEKPFSASSLQN